MESADWSSSALWATCCVDSCVPLNLHTIWSNLAQKDRKSTRLNSSHNQISYAGFCLKNKSNIGLVDHGLEHVQLDLLVLEHRAQLNNLSPHGEALGDSDAGQHLVLRGSLGLLASLVG